MGGRRGAGHLSSDGRDHREAGRMSGRFGATFTITCACGHPLVKHVTVSGRPCELCPCVLFVAVKPQGSKR